MANHPAELADLAHPAQAVAGAVLAHPGVARLSGGPFGTIASYLPGRRVVGVRLPLREADAVEIAIVARLGVPLPLLAEQLGAAVVGVLGPVAVDVTVADVEMEAETDAVTEVGPSVAVDVETAAPHPARP